jgi:CRISPR-associated protein Cas1
VFSKPAAAHVNAMLNYGYGVLKGTIQGEIIAAGLNPGIGVMHSGSENKAPLVYDLVEPMRPVIDRTVWKFALSNTFTPGDFTINRSGGCQVNPQMAKVVGRKAIELPVKPVLAGFLKSL